MLRNTNKLLSAVFSVVICIVSISPHISAYAETTTIPVPGAIYDTGEKGDYNISDDSITEEFNSFGTFSIAGDLVQTDNVEADWNENALAKAKDYQEHMSMSNSAIYDQLTSEYGEKFTEEEAQYAVDHLD